MIKAEPTTDEDAIIFSCGGFTSYSTFPQAVVATKIIISMGWQGSVLSYHEDSVEVVHFLCRVNIKMTLNDVTRRATPPFDQSWKVL